MPSAPIPAAFDWNFYATESSVIFKLEPTQEHPYWVEVHGHFGRFGTVPISIMITSHAVGLGDGVEFLESVLTDLFWRRLPNFFRQRGPGVGVELQPSIYYFGIRLQCHVLAYDNPKRLDLPHQARQQVERILRSIPPEELSPLAMGFEGSALDPQLETKGSSDRGKEQIAETSFPSDVAPHTSDPVLNPPVSQPGAQPNQQTLKRRRTAARASHAAAKQRPASPQISDPVSPSQAFPSEPSPWDETAPPELPHIPQAVLAKR